MDKRNTTVIIDGNSVAYRIFYKAPPLSANGMQTGVVHAFLSVINSFQKRANVSEILITFDPKGKTFRHEMHDEYKATRDATPEELVKQILLLQEIIPYMGIPIYMVPGYEADDAINTLAQNSQSEKVWIVTKDKDLYQLVSDKIAIYDYQKNIEFDRAGVHEKFGVYPEQIMDMLSLMGDSSDNIPGVKGVGEKTAVTLINKYGDLDNLYAHVDELKGKQQENIIRDKELAYKSKDLIKLAYIENLAEVKATKDVQKLLEYFTLYKLTVQLNRLKSEENISQELSDSVAEEVIELKPLTEGEPKEILMLGYINDELTVFDNTHYREYREGDTPKYYFDIKALYKQGVEVDKSKIDILLAHWLVGGVGYDVVQTKTEDLGTYLARVASIAEPSVIKLKSEGLDKLYSELELPIVFILADAEKQGIKINANIIHSVESELKGEIAKLLNSMYNTIGDDININSTKQLGKYLFDKLGMEPPKKNKSGYSTDEETLQSLLEKYPEHSELLENILKYRELNKILSTYTSSLLEYADGRGYIHTDFKQTGTATGRLSSANPNLQNIPQRSKLADRIRSAFEASEGYTFVSFDYSQIELRVLAHLSGDANLVYAFNHDVDIHDMTAKRIFGVEEVDADHRRIAKAVNFGILYGLSSFGLARDVKISNAEGKRFIESYFELYPSVRSYIDTAIEEAKKVGYSTTVMGRKRFIPELNSRNGAIRNRAERIASNAPMQGSAADIIKVAMIECDRYIKDNNVNARLILQIHDELVFEVADDIVESFMVDIKRIMETSFELAVPLTVNGFSAKNWGEL